MLLIVALMYILGGHLMKKLLAFLLFTGTLISGTPSVSANQTFSDLNPASHSWAMDSISFMMQKEVIKGDEKGRFNPDAKVTKAEFVTMVHRLFDKYRPIESEANYFLDVPKNHWAYTEITELASLMDFGHYAYHTENGQKFAPDQPLTRMGAVNLIPPIYDQVTGDEAYSIVSGMKDFNVIVDSEEIEDNRYEYGVDMTNTVFPLVFDTTPDGAVQASDDYSHIASISVASLYKLGIMTTHNGEFEAAELLTRAEAVTILHRFYNYLENSRLLSEFSSK
jgi:S-layer homology domain